MARVRPARAEPDRTGVRASILGCPVHVRAQAAGQFARPTSSHGSTRSRSTDCHLLVHHAQVALHRDRLQLAEPVAVRVVEEREQEQQQRDHQRHAGHHHHLGPGVLAGVGEEQHVHEDDGGDDVEHEPERERDQAHGSVHAVDPGLLAVGGLVQPPVVRRLLGVAAGREVLEGLEHLHAPRVHGLADRAVGHGGPLRVHHRACVADELAAERVRGGLREVLRGLELLRDDRRLGLRAGACLVVGVERQEDDEAEEHREARGQDAEDARGAVAVREVAALGARRRTKSIALQVNAVTTTAMIAPTTMFMARNIRVCLQVDRRARALHVGALPFRREQDRDAQHEHPGREDQLRPAVVAAGEEEQDAARP